MWIFAKSGFYSIVQSRTKPGMMEVRARCRDDLINLNKIIGDSRIIHKTENRDYAYRVYINKRILSKFVDELVDDIDYDNFKDTILALDDSVANSIRCRFYERVWSLMCSMQVAMSKPKEWMERRYGNKDLQ